jgi:hypothetical protein
MRFLSPNSINQMMIFIFPMLQYEEDCGQFLRANLMQVDLASSISNRNCVAELHLDNAPIPVPWNVNTSAVLLEHVLTENEPWFSNTTTTCGRAIVQLLASNPNALYLDVRGLVMVDRRREIGETIRGTHAFIQSTGNSTDAYFTDGPELL